MAEGSQIIAQSRPIDRELSDLSDRIGSWRYPVCLRGHHEGGPAGRWSILSAYPRRIFESASGVAFEVSSRSEPIAAGPDALVGLAALIDQFRLAGDPNGLDQSLPFLGGLIGFLSYDLAPRIEGVPRRHLPSCAMPVIRFGLYDTFVLVDHTQNQANLWGVDLLGEGTQAVAARLDGWSKRLQQPAPDHLPPGSLGPVRADLTPREYRRMIEQAKRYIEAGDIFQVNLAQRFTATGSVDLLALDRRLRSVSPAPYSAYLAWDQSAILSASPELFYETRGRTIRTRPIKGTRPRFPDQRRDEASRTELLASPKDLAELTMIIDLERNDLGRICEFGSVQVIDSRSVESFRNVHHTVATVGGRLRDDVGPIDVVRALFPGGSITGAPKIRAMEIIDELEPCRRGIYTGSIGFWSANGRSTFNIAIRTISVVGSELSYHVGGGIVADSDPAEEHQETLDKGRGLLAALSPGRGDQ